MAWIENHLDSVMRKFLQENPDFPQNPNSFKSLEDARSRYGYSATVVGFESAWRRVQDEELVGRVTDPWQLSQVEMLAKQAREAKEERRREQLKWNRKTALQDFYNIQQQMNLAQQQAAGQSAANQQWQANTSTTSKNQYSTDWILQQGLAVDPAYQKQILDLYNQLFPQKQQPPVDWQRQDEQELREHVAKSSTMQFGKYRGMELRDVPADYLEWSISTMEADAKRYRDELARREAVENSSVDLISQLLKAGFKELAKKAHPDTGGSQEQFLALKGAFETLKIAAEAIKETKCTT